MFQKIMSFPDVPQSQRRAILIVALLYAGMGSEWGWCEPPPLPAPQAESLLVQPVTLRAVTPSATAAETQWLPLGEVIQQYSETTGNQIRMSEQLQKNDKFLSRVYSANDTSWLENFSRIEVFNEHSGKKEIILLKSHAKPSLARPSLKRAPRKHPRKNSSRYYYNKAQKKKNAAR